MTWLRKRKHALLPPVEQEIIDAHKEAIAVKRETEERRPVFKEIAENMIHRHRLNGFGEKLEATYQGKGLL